MFAVLWKLTTSALVTGFLTFVGVIVGLVLTLIVDSSGNDPNDAGAMGFLLILLMFIFGVIGFSCGIGLSVANW